MELGGVAAETLLIVAILIAIVAFFYSNLGLGGGQLYVPIMLLSFGGAFSVSEVIPLSLSFAFVTMLAATYSHNRKRLVDFRLGTKLAVAGILGVVGGMLFTTNVNEYVIKAAFATMLVVVGTKMMYDIYSVQKDQVTSPTTHNARVVLAGMAVSIVTGFLIGSFGIGGGVVSVPLIIYVFKFEPRKAIGTSALMGAILTPAAIVAYVLNQSVSGSSEIPYDIAIVLTPIVLLFALVGSRWGLERLNTRIVKTIFTCGLYLASIGMLYSILSA